VPSYPWGSAGHDYVTSAAIEAIPEELQPFYKKNSRMIIALAVLPDWWKDTHRADESFRHFINLEYYSTMPGFTDIPRSFKDAEAKYGRKNMINWGVLPWAIVERSYRLSEAFRKEDLEEIAVQSSILSHYVADLHMPLHTTKHYDGLTDAQDGLHGRFEFEVLDRFVSSEDITPGIPPIITDPWESVFSWMIETHSKVDALNQADIEARAKTQSYNAAYYDDFARIAKPMAVNQLSQGAARLAALYTWAWTKAGKPDIPAKWAPLYWDDLGAKKTEPAKQ